MATNAMGPTMAGGTQPIVKGGYELLYLPDVNNHELQRAGNSPVFYYIPNRIRMARKDGPDTGDYLFNLIRFAGVQSSETTVGADSDREVAGGVLTFTVTGAVPDDVLEQSQSEITSQFENSGDYFWGIRSRKPPLFRPAIITSNVTTVSNVSPSATGTSPTDVSDGGARGQGRMLRSVGIPKPRRLPRTARGSDAAKDSNLDPWYWRMQGEGSGSIDPTGQNAFSALIGAYPAAILWESFHGTASPVTVVQSMKLKVWSPVVELHILGEWTRIFEHFSAAASARYLWAKADVQAELNKMRQNGDITVDLKIDPTIPNGDKIQENIEERSDMILEKFLEEAQRVIFEPPQPEVEAAEASSGGGLFGGVGLALKARKDITTLTLEYHETRQLAYLQDHTISSSLAGMYEEMHRDPEAENKYFRTVHLDDWPRKLARVVKPVANWENGAVDFMSVDIGYPNTSGELMWSGHAFGPSDGGDGSWKYAMTQKNESDVEDPPEGWSPDKTFVKRRVHLKEPPSETQDPYRRIQIDQNVIPIDPEPNGRAVNDTILEVRADSAGRLDVGPIELGVVLQDNTQTIQVTMEPTDPQGDPIGRNPVRFVWNYDDYDHDRLWMLFTGDPEFQPFYRYKVHVLVKGTIFEPGREWEGPWETAAGGGPVILKIPQPGGRGVSPTRQIPVFAEAPRSRDSRPSSTSAEPGEASSASAQVRGYPIRP